HPTRVTGEHMLGNGRPRALHQLVERPFVCLLGAPRLGRGQQRNHASTTTATAAASSCECVIESSIRPAPTRSAKRAVRPLRWTPGFGRPFTSISFQVKYTPEPSALPTASLAAKRPA